MKKILTGQINVSWKKYEVLQEQYVRNGWITNVFPIDVGCRAFIANPTSVFLTNLGFPLSDKRKYIEKIQDKALSASAWIWQSHRVTTIWQSLVVSWDTAGALWASGNDASAPKPCLNSESSSDEGFVWSNTVVQTSVIVWYLLELIAQLFYSEKKAAAFYDFQGLLHKLQEIKNKWLTNLAERRQLITDIEDTKKNVHKDSTEQTGTHHH